MGDVVVHPFVDLQGPELTLVRSVDRKNLSDVEQLLVGELRQELVQQSKGNGTDAEILVNENVQYAGGSQFQVSGIELGDVRNQGFETFDFQIAVHLLQTEDQLVHHGLVDDRRVVFLYGIDARHVRILQALAVVPLQDQIQLIDNALVRFSHLSLHVQQHAGHFRCSSIDISIGVLHVPQDGVVEFVFGQIGG